MNKFLVYVVSPLTLLLMFLINTKEYQKFLLKYPEIQYYVYLTLGVTILANYYFGIFSPYKKCEKLSKIKWSLFEKHCESFLENITVNEDISFNMNIMVPKWRFVNKIEPSVWKWFRRKISFNSKVFEVVFDIGKESVDHRLKITENQGLCGEAYRSGRRVDGTNLKNRDNNFNEDQKEQTKNLTFLMCCPIVSKTNGTSKRKVLGVLSIESTSSKAAELFLNEKNVDKLYTHKMEPLSILCRKLLE